MLVFYASSLLINTFLQGDTLKTIDFNLIKLENLVVLCTERRVI